MTEYTLKMDSRHLKREFQKALRGSIPKILTELITNADDSYRRLAQRNKNGENTMIGEMPAPIVIEFNRRKSLFSVTDHAEGLTDKEMQDSFVTYGKDSRDRQKGINTRSLFGKGLRDVLFTQLHGRVKSIKDNKFYVCEFRLKNKAGEESPVIEIKPSRPVDDQLRKALDIPANGTRVEFELGRDVRKPQTQKLLEALSNFYMLRSILSNDNRQVKVRVISKGKDFVEHTIKFVAPVIDVKQTIDLAFSPDSQHSIQITGEIGLTDAELPQGEAGYTDRVGGILVIDEDDAVLDLSLFGYDYDPAARRISGHLCLRGIGAFIREKLNQENPEEILTDTRDGFNQNYDFFRQLRDKIKPLIAPLVDDLREQSKEIKLHLSEETQKRHRNAFDLLNKLAKDLLGNVGQEPGIPDHIKKPPSSGILFLRSEVVIRAGVLTPVPLLINTAMFGENDLVTLKSENSDIFVSPAFVPLTEDSKLTNPLIKMLRLRADVPGVTGRVIAQCSGSHAELQVRVIAREIVTPIDGLQFEKNEYKLRVDGTRSIRLYIDLAKIPLGSELRVAAETADINLNPQIFTVSGTDIVAADIACREISLSGKGRKVDTYVRASCLAYVTETKLRVIEREENKEHGAQGLFKDYRFNTYDGLPVQTYFDEDTGSININLADPVNRRYFTDTESGATKAVEEQAHCQVRLADLILNECLQHMVSRAYSEGVFEKKYPDDPALDIRRYADEKRFDIGLPFHNLFVTKA